MKSLNQLASAVFETFSQVVLDGKIGSLYGTDSLKARDLCVKDLELLLISRVD